MPLLRLRPWGFEKPRVDQEPVAGRVPGGCADARVSAFGTTAVALVCLTLATFPAVAQVVGTSVFDDALHRGDSAWSLENYPAAHAAYAQAVAIDSTRSSRAIFRLATIDAWDNHLDAAIAGFRRYLVLEPQDDEGRIALARTLSLAGRLDAAEAEYRSLLRGQDRLHAEIGLARVAAWRGDLGASESRWRSVLAQTPDDPEALTGLAQTLLWEGNPRLARTMLRRALTMQPGYGDAHALLPWIDAALAPMVRPSVDHFTDSDGNHVTTVTVDASTEALWNGRVGATLRERSASFGGTPGVAAGRC